MSDIKNELNHYLTHPNQYVSKVATHILNLAKGLEAGQVTEDEFNELSQDILDTAHIAKASSDIKMQANIEKAVKAMIALLPKIVGIATGK